MADSVGGCSFFSNPKNVNQDKSHSQVFRCVNKLTCRIQSFYYSSVILSMDYLCLNTMLLEALLKASVMQLCKLWQMDHLQSLRV